MRPSLLPSRPRNPLLGSSSTSYSTSSSLTPNSSSAASSASAIVRPVVSTHSMVIAFIGPAARARRGESELLDATDRQRRLRFLLFRRRALPADAPLADPPVRVPPVDPFPGPGDFAPPDGCPARGFTAPFVPVDLLLSPLPSSFAAPFAAAGSWNSLR